MPYRKEKKFRLSKCDMDVLKEKLTLQGMQPLFPGRLISSIYFDNHAGDMFHDSEEGVFPRKKVRVRWYNNQSDFTEEIKISSFEGRFKTTKRLEKTHPRNKHFFTNYIDPDYGLLKPVIKISYNRSYYELKKLRVKFDTSITYQDLNVLEKGVFSDPENVVEIKTPMQCGDDYIQSILGNPTERFSKYCRGILSINAI